MSGVQSARALTPIDTLVTIFQSQIKLTKITETDLFVQDDFQQTRQGQHRLMNLGKSSLRGNLFEHVATMRASYFDTDFVSHMKLTILPLIHCFDGAMAPLDPLLCKVFCKGVINDDHSNVFIAINKHLCLTKQEEIIIYYLDLF